MDLKDKIIGMALVALISLVGWNLHETWGMKEEVFKLQQGQIVLSRQIQKNSAFVKQKLKQIKKKQNKKIVIYLIHLFVFSICCLAIFLLFKSFKVLNFMFIYHKMLFNIPLKII